MINRSDLNEAADFLRNYNDFLVVSHLLPDGDAISSTLSMGWLLNRLGKRYHMINQDSIESKYDILCGSTTIKTPEDMNIKQTDIRAVISVDCADHSRVGTAEILWTKQIPLLNVDHHETNERYGHVNLVDPNAASTTQVLYELIKAMSVSLDQQVAECLYTGLLTDTGGFRYSNSTPTVFHMAGDLVDQGIRNHQLSQHFLERMSSAQLALLQRALNSLSFSESGQIAWVILSLEDQNLNGSQPSDSEGIVNYPRNIDGVEIGVFFKQVNEQEWKVSLRSGDKVDVSIIAQYFEGGGHRKAAGFSLLGNLESVVNKVTKRLELSLC